MRKMMNHRTGRNTAAAVLIAIGVATAVVPVFQYRIPVYAAEVTSKKIADDKVVYDATAEMQARENMLYRFVVPDCNIDVAVFDGDIDVIPNSQRQAVVDAEDSAIQFHLHNDDTYDPLVGDHASQGFSRLGNAVPGQTLLYLNGSGTTTVYRCVEVEIGLGKNTKSDLLDKDGNSLRTRRDSCLVTYTCHGEGASTPSYMIWEPIGTVANTADGATNFLNAQIMVAQEDAKHAAAAEAEAETGNVK